MTFLHRGAPTPCPSTHDPDSKVWYNFVWDDWLPGGAEILESAWIVTTGLTIEDYVTDVALSINDRGVETVYQHVNRIKLSGGTAGSNYTVTNRVTTTDPDAQTVDKSMVITCQDQ